MLRTLQQLATVLSGEAQACAFLREHVATSAFFCTASSSATTSRPSNKWRCSLEHRLKASFRPDAPEWQGPTHAAVILERNPICFEDPDAWDAEHTAWQESWNRWKYKKVEGDWLNGDKQMADANSAEVNRRSVSPGIWI
jgi:hypothetical protein